MERLCSVSNPGDLVLLDLDGTVIDIAALPTDVTVDAGLKSDLLTLHARDPFGLVVVTGRALADVDRLLTPLRLPAIASHGAELRVAGTVADGSALPVRYLQRMIETAMRPFLVAGAVLEWKPFSAAIHVRAVPELASSVSQVLDEFVAKHGNLRVQPGRHVFEVLPSSISKAQAVRRLMQHLPYAGRRPLYIGDDSADEDAMRVILAMDGEAFCVAGEYFPPEVSRFGSPADVRSWLSTRANPPPSGTSSQSSRCLSD